MVEYLMPARLDSAFPGNRLVTDFTISIISATSFGNRIIAPFRINFEGDDHRSIDSSWYITSETIDGVKIGRIPLLFDIRGKVDEG
ncbi:hypothetical protein SS1G_07932 [Sclerotinia sclerotiorum 1980 UF-70]|uniref:Uncharacterized protein n=1 Tax=Sclerotinia sclerotiorum (strain ATCC 18683 / 1980 / Ss-1) TaxID=665079 RepID=A7ERH8_SCLS1|nr:hypothetical protein SS1G_07932 [Sclerotinia sclerotiorum 1980 UF-70]EDN92070.1 hypothetical protein SS1G_07932 [Sclerotinia sclerotiorum 1980 UF-70]